MNTNRNKAAACIFAVMAGVIAISSKSAVCGELIDIKHQAVLANKPDNIVSAGFWIPAKKETAEALLAINNYLVELSTASYSEMPRTTTQNSVAPTKTQIFMILKNFSKYRVQFMGIKFDGRKVIYSNFFMYDAEKYKNWKKKYVDVSDGGSAFWQIDYDMNSKICDALTINSGNILKTIELNENKDIKDTGK